MTAPTNAGVLKTLRLMAGLASSYRSQGAYYSAVALKRAYAKDQRAIAAVAELIAVAEKSLDCMQHTVASGGIAEGSIDACIDSLTAALARCKGGA